MFRKGLCPNHITQKLVPGLKWCQTCIDKRKTYEQALSAAGMCKGHPKRKAVPGTKRCHACSNSSKRRFAENNAKGKCRAHPKRNTAPGLTMCRICLEYMLKKSEGHRIRLKSLGKCPGHPNETVLKGRTYCQKCASHSKRRREERLAQGKCPQHPFRNVALGLTRCLACHEKMLRTSGVYSGIRRAKQFLTPYEDVDRVKVFERDEWKCKHCGEQVDLSNAKGDHIVPISLGGPHCYWNFQCLCGKCNGTKGFSIHREPKLAHLVHLPMKELIEAFAREQGATLPRGWWELRNAA
jgi:5-methylcytosine-specific restriction endonuclease McrA